MNSKKKVLLLGIITLLLSIITLLIPKVNQDISYHDFADNNSLFGIPNFWNVFSNLPFLVIGFIGLKRLNALVIEKTKYVLLSTLFVGIILTGLGSGYYHLHPTNYSLVWDRIPMTIVFMSFLSLVIYDKIDKRIGEILALPFIITGISSVLYWIVSENSGSGDLRLYGFIQFYPMVMIPLIMVLYRNKENNIKWLAFVILYYAIAKFFEHFDFVVFALTPLSGHSLKHLFAAFSTFYIVRYYTNIK